jgi:hypothetical protein
MRWKDKTVYQIGHHRERFPFAWTPTRVGDYTVWLERYWVKEKLVGIAYDKEMWVEVERAIACYYY